MKNNRKVIVKSTRKPLAMHALVWERNKASITQTQLAKAAGVSQAYISSLENGEDYASRELVGKFMTIFPDLDFTDFLKGDKGCKTKKQTTRKN
jgi:transcriptional regulator with XRE-family HTH domain